MEFTLTFHEKQSLSSFEQEIESYNKKCFDLHKVMRNITDERMLKTYLKEYDVLSKKVHGATSQRQMFIDGLIKKYNIND
jgi:predicted  nucleic acid-binding Zn-ribbon protein